MIKKKNLLDEIMNGKLDLIALRNSLDDLEKKYSDLLNQQKTQYSDLLNQQKTPGLDQNQVSRIADQGSRIADLEVKMAKIWSLLIDVTNTGKEKPSKTAKKIGQQLF